MIWIMRLAGLAFGAAGVNAVGFLIYQRLGTALDLPGCADPSAQTILTLDSAAMAAFVVSGLLLVARRRPAGGPAR